MSIVLLPVTAQGQDPLMLNLQRAFASELSRVGLSYGEGLKLATEGLAQATIESGKAAQVVHQLGARETVSQGLARVPQFLRSVIAHLQQDITTGRVTSANARSMLVRGRTWQQGAVNLNAFLEIMFWLAYAAPFAYVGNVATHNYLDELRQTANEAEEKAYIDLVKLLIQRTTTGQVVLCRGMTFGEAATRLRINLQTSPGRPYWNIICDAPKGGGASVAQVGDPTGRWSCPGRGILILNGGEKGLSGSFAPFPDGTGDWRGSNNGPASGGVEGSRWVLLLHSQNGWVARLTVDHLIPGKSIAGVWQAYNGEQAFKLNKPSSGGNWHCNR